MVNRYTYRKFRKNDEIDALLDKYLPLIYSQVNKFADKHNTKEELLSEAFMTFMNTLEKRHDKNYGAYLKKCLYYNLLKYVKKKQDLKNTQRDIHKHVKFK